MYIVDNFDIDDLVHGNLTLAACQRHVGAADGVHSADDIALDAGNFHQACNGIADEPHEVGDVHGNGVADLLTAAAAEGHQCACRHGRGSADLGLAAAGSTGNRALVGDDSADTAGNVQRLKDLMLADLFILVQG